MKTTTTNFTELELVRAQAFAKAWRLLTGNGVCTDVDYYQDSEPVLVTTAETAIEAGLMEFEIFSDPKEFAEALMSSKANSHYNRCDYGIEFKVQYSTAIGSVDWPIEAVDEYEGNIEHENEGAVPSFPMDKECGVLVQTVDIADAGRDSYKVYCWYAYVYQPDTDKDALSGDYRQARNREDLRLFVGDELADQVIGAMDEEAANDLACAIRSDRVDLKDLREEAASSKKLQRALTVRVSYAESRPGCVDGSAGTKVVGEWGSSPFSAGESAKICYWHRETDKPYARTRIHKRPRVDANPGNCNWYLIKVKEWASWPVDGSNFCRYRYRLVLL